MTATALLAQARLALQQWDLGGRERNPSLQLIVSGVNQTFRVTTQAGCYALQQLSPQLSAGLHQDIQVVTQHLHHKGLVTPRLVSTSAGELFARVENRSWRLCTWVNGVSHHAISTAAMAHEAGRLVAMFHVALADLRHTYHVDASWVHNAQTHLQQLRQAMVEGADHPLHAEAVSLADPIFRLARNLPHFDELPHRHSHGDLKISNLLFAQKGQAEGENRALALIDLDTLGTLPWPLELGDALRSWCNPQGEESAHTRFDSALMLAALQGYARELPAGFLQPKELKALIPGLLRVTLVLAARFLTDALRECHFGWDKTRFASRGQHNLIRAQGQLALYHDMQRQPLHSLVAKAFHKPKPCGSGTA